MRLFVLWVNRSLVTGVDDPVRLAVASHVLFETIHPFRDGNGRAGRILLNYLLIGQGFVNIAIKGIRNADRKQYYQALETADDAFERMLRQIAQHFNYSQDYLRNLINKKKIPAVKKGKLWYIKVRDMQAYINSLSP